MQPVALARVIGISCLLVVISHAQGPLTPPPGAPAPTMKTLDQVEPRTPITNLPYTISLPGSYYLVASLTGISGTNGITIASSQVSLDLMGHTLQGVAGSLRGIATAGICRNLTIRNGVVTGWGTDGIDLRAGGTGTGALVEGIHSASNGGMGMRINNNAVVRDCLVSTNGSQGISVAENTIVERCVSQGNAGAGFIGTTAVVIKDCTARSNLQAGFQVNSDCTLEGNTARANSGAGIRGQVDRNLIRNNTCLANATGIQLDGEDNHVTGNRVLGNTVNYTFSAGNQLDLLLGQIPQTISWPASVKLAGSLTGISGTNGITITTSNVTIDLMGHTLQGVAGSWHGIDLVSTQANIIVRNGHVSRWDIAGINLRHARNGMISDIQATGNNGEGILAGEGFSIRDCTASTNGTGILTGDGSAVENCAAIDNRFIGFNLGNNNAIQNSGAIGNGNYGIAAGSGSSIHNCVANGNQDGFFLNTGCGITDSIARNNDVRGIYGWGEDVNITRCTTALNDTHGIRVLNNSTVRDNQCSNNGWTGNGAGILVEGEGNRVEGNHCADADHGIRVTSPGNFLARNTCSGNATNWSIVADNVCLVVSATTTTNFTGDAGGQSPGSTNPWANYSF